MPTVEGPRLQGTADRWANYLGLAASPLFGPGDAPVLGNHFAMLDGRRGSFVCSLLDTFDTEVDKSRSWRFSADLAHHVEITANEVLVRSGREEQRRFDRASIERQLDSFFRFLDAPRHATLPDVVTFLLGEFAQLWATIPAGVEHTGHEALSAFLIALAAAGETNPGIVEDAEWRRSCAHTLGLDGLSVSLLDGMRPATIERAVTLQSRAPLGLRLEPALVLRHAAGRLFQDAHAHLETSSQLGLFGNDLARLLPATSPTGAYFTPVPIARLLAESAIDQLASLPPTITVADYACGSAVFLTEALRVLERRDYRGRVRLVGRDISPAAVSMAKVAIAATSRDLSNVEVVPDIQVADALAFGEWPTADVVLMNPPFRSWESMSAAEREWVRNVLPQRRGGRADLSVGFIARAIDSLSAGGSLATLVPAGVLSSEGLAPWRTALLERATPTLLAVLGEHGLFRHALVNVGVIALSKVAYRNEREMLTLAWAAPDSGAAAGAMRAIRRTTAQVSGRSSLASERSLWTVTRAEVVTLKERPSWLPGANALGPLLDDIRASVQTRVEALFAVRQGIRTGAKEVFVQPAQVVAKLPKDERRWFVPAIVTESFHDGQLLNESMVFMADALWRDEDEVRAAIPKFFEHVLLPARDVLRGRAGIDTNKWWLLTRARGWMLDGVPRLVSKRFGLVPAFARDDYGRSAVVQANAWVPKPLLMEGIPQGAAFKEHLRGLLVAYWWLLNSSVAVSLLREYCPNVAGGQLDLEHKYVRHMPLPNLASALADDPGLSALATDMR